MCLREAVAREGRHQFPHPFRHIRLRCHFFRQPRDKFRLEHLHLLARDQNATSPGAASRLPPGSFLPAVAQSAALVPGRGSPHTCFAAPAPGLGADELTGSSPLKRRTKASFKPPCSGPGRYSARATITSSGVFARDFSQAPTRIPGLSIWKHPIVCPCSTRRAVSGSSSGIASNTSNVWPDIPLRRQE